MTGNFRALLKAVTVIILLGSSAVTSVAAQQQVQPAEISSVELHPGRSSRMFTLRVRCSRFAEFTAFWVGGRTFVLDIHNTFTPFRGDAAREWAPLNVGAVRASQFMENPIPIARIEIDVLFDVGSVVRRSGGALEVSFGPSGPAFPAAGGWVPPSGTGTETVAPPDTGTVALPIPIPSDQSPAVRPTVPLTGGRENPFDPILKPVEGVDLTNTQERPLPDAEELVLTGIIFDVDNPAETTALLRTGQGATFRLRIDDRVMYGFVSQITAQEIVFSLDIYGRRKEVRLALPPNPLER